MQSDTSNIWNIRLATLEDVPRLLEIYSYYVERTNISFEYVTPSLQEFEQRFSDISKKYPYLVLEESGDVVGYAYANTFKGRAAYNWSVETTVYIDKDCRSGGRGRALYLKLEEYLKQQNILNANACITSPYSDSAKFHEKMGYKLIAHFHKCGYKFNEWHDMIWMEKILGEHKKSMPDVIWFEDLIK